MPADLAPTAPPIPSGAVVQVRYTKYDGAPHWAFDGPFLGTDAFGAWVGAPAGTRWSRPGWTFDAESAAVVLFPAAGWTGTYNATHPEGQRLYLDLTTRPVWGAVDGTWQVTMADLDLDVITRADGTIWIDDEDEFAEHRVSYGYPADLVATVEADALDLLRRAGAGDRPFDGMRRPYAPAQPATADRWLELLARVTAR
ncbi:hypothetical protein Xcel_1004 [Xylanimonas cellulosilytica DSM 15894]|uniref:DUF402 domain-containing protein n=1 Tax=Xylanimonas cellulosilytica (strain DSM 15894 / JCM 12276 / CECT 5975 / KCTC 9989 / LMG 20990 / NBRC 107835 / XIL07) TaxID=446471 RepID=D1BYW0_XYLCX|nr:DUF402 domain-containing protein [Xylanimonas cellulosilytica]ACZ30035.1 hypothetical protein Xcel_1004 [Xylanimonas cellulosilytica DSM 15894]